MRDQNKKQVGHKKVSEWRREIKRSFGLGECVCWGGGVGGWRIKKVCESCEIIQTLSSNGLYFQLTILVFYSIQANTDLCTVDD